MLYVSDLKQDSPELLYHFHHHNFDGEVVQELWLGDLFRKLIRSLKMDGVRHL